MIFDTEGGREAHNGGFTGMTIRVSACRTAIAVQRMPLCTSCRVLDVAARYTRGTYIAASSPYRPQLTLAHSG